MKVTSVFVKFNNAIKKLSIPDADKFGTQPHFVLEGSGEIPGPSPYFLFKDGLVAVSQNGRWLAMKSRPNPPTAESRFVYRLSLESLEWKAIKLGHAKKLLPTKGTIRHIAVDDNGTVVYAFEPRARSGDRDIRLFSGEPNTYRGRVAITLGRGRRVKSTELQIQCMDIGTPTIVACTSDMVFVCQEKDTREFALPACCKKPRMVILDRIDPLILLWSNKKCCIFDAKRQQLSSTFIAIPVEFKFVAITITHTPSSQWSAAHVSLWCAEQQTTMPIVIANIIALYTTRTSLEFIGKTERLSFDLYSIVKQFTMDYTQPTHQWEPARCPLPSDSEL